MTRGDGDFNALGLLARGLSGIDLEVQALAGRPATRAVLAGRRLRCFQMALKADRRGVPWLLMQSRTCGTRQPGAPPALKPMSVAVVSAIEDARVERLLCRDFPGFSGSPNRSRPPPIRWICVLRR